MNWRNANILLLALAGLTPLASGADAVSMADISAQRIGEFVTVRGHVAEFYPPPEPRAPYAFDLKEVGGQQMRVVAWPDIYERVDNHQLLKAPGTSVTLTAEVAEYKEKLELHLQDWEEITVEAGTEDTTTTASAEGTTEVLNMREDDGVSSQAAWLSTPQPDELQTSGSAASE